MTGLAEQRTLLGRDAQLQPSQNLRAAIANNPFRTPEILAENRDVRLQAMRRSMRGLSVLGVDGKVWVWLSQFLMLPLLYFSTSFGADVNAWAFPGGPVPSSTSVYLLTLASVIFAFCLAYAALYGSDPGFLDSHQRPASAEQTATQQLQLRGASACAYCGCIPTARSKHSKGSGQCVHKFDHFCWWLSTDIGDRNHGVFWVYLMLQCGLHAWAGHLLLSAMLVCGGVTPSDARGLRVCRSQVALQWSLLLVQFGIVVGTGVLFVYLAGLHTYLLLTGQTMYEILRGGKVDYLTPYYSGRARRHYKLPDEVLSLLGDEVMGRGPPRPFSEGMVNNVLLQLTRSWPRPYTPKC